MNGTMRRFGVYLLFVMGLGVTVAQAQQPVAAEPQTASQGSVPAVVPIGSSVPLVV